VALSVALVVATAPVAQAKKTRPLQPAAFTVPASNGYRLDVAAAPRGRVLVSAYQGPALATYSARGTVENGTIHAQFGSLGSASMTFHRTGTKRIKLPCGRDRVRVMTGTFDGSFSFNGEEGFTSASVSQAEAVVFPYPYLDLFCFGTTESIGYGDGAELDGFGNPSGHEQISWAIAKDRPGADAGMFASVKELHDGVLIDRHVFAHAPPSSFSWDSKLRTAQVVAPGGPFSGDASFSAPATLSGSLSVSFPGESNVPLAGPDFAAQIYRIG
jgi:hypothetical protein